MSDEQTVKLRVTADTSELTAAAADAKAQIASIGDSAQAAAAKNADIFAKQNSQMVQFTRSSGDAAKTFNDQQAALGGLLGKIDPVVGSFEKLDAQYAALKAFKASGALGGEDFAIYAAKIEGARAALGGVAGGLHLVGAESNLARREVAVLGAELARGNYTRAEASLVTLARATGVLGMVMSAGGLAVGGFIAIVGGATLIYAKAEAEIGAFDRALLNTGNYAQLTTAQLVQQVSVIGDATGHYGDAQVALTLLAGSGKFAGANLEIAAQGAVAFADLTGKSIEEAVKEFEKLAADPVAGLLKANEAMHFLTASEMEQVLALVDIGDKTGAAQLATELFAKALTDREKEYNDSLTGISAGWRNLKTIIGEAYQASKTFMDQKASSFTSVVQSMTLTNPMMWPVTAAASLFGGSAASGVVAGSASENQQAIAAAAATKAQTAAQRELNDVLIESGVAFNKEDVALQKEIETHGKGKVGLIEYMIQQKLMTAASTLSGDALITATNAILDQGNVALTAAGKVDALTAKHKLVPLLSGAFEALAQAATDASNKIGDTLADKAYAKYNAAVERANKLAETALIDGFPLNAIFEQQNILLAAAKDAYDSETAAIGDFDTAMQTLSDTYAKEEQLAGLSTEARKIAVEVEKAEAAALKELQLENGKYYELQPQEKAAIDALAKAHVGNTNAIENEKKATQDYQNIVESSMSSMVTSFLSGTLSMAASIKQMVIAIIAEVIKLRVLGPMVASFFGTGAAYGMSYGASALGAAADFSNVVAGGSGTDFTSTASGGTGNSLFGTAMNVIGAGKLMWQGFSSGFSNMFSTSAYTMGPPTAAGSTSSFVQPQAGVLGQALGIAGGLYAGYNEYQNAGGGVAGLAGGAAYGVATYAIGTAVATGVSSGMALGLASIGPIGWVAIAAMALDMISGGKLFGNSKVVGGNTTETIGAGGASVGTNYTTKDQGAFFSGASWNEHAMASDPKAIAAADAFFAALQKGIDGFAKQFGVTAGAVVGGSFQQAFDASGKVTGTTTQIGGQTYTGETAAQFEERVQSANYLAVLDQLGVGASAFVAGLQGDADKLFAAVQDFATATQAANVDIGKGLHFLADGAGTTLVSVMKFVEGLQLAGETLTQTYARLAQAQNAYDQFVVGFKAPVTYVDDFEAALAGIGNTMKANIAQANLLAKAAGAEGAATSDLVAIWQYAAVQEAALVKALEASAQSNAFSLGLTTQGSLTDVNAEIARLQGIAGNATVAVQNFGGAMVTASQSATDAINLLLGTLSPLNDQQKLQTAMAGLRAGTVTQDAVLQIGRSLYASSQAYTDLFNQVRGIPGLQSGAGAGAQSGGSSSAAAATGLTATEQARLTSLLAIQPGLEAAQTLSQYQTFAQQVAEIAMAKGEDFKVALADLGVKQADLEKGLGLKTDADLAAYFANIALQTDSATQNTTSIVDELALILNAILYGTTGGFPGTVLGGNPSGDPLSGNQWGGNYTPPTAPTGGTGGNLGGGGNDPGGRVVWHNVQRGSMSTDPAVATLQDVRTLLTSILAATTSGSGNVVGAVRDTAEAVRGVDRTLVRGTNQASINDRRNGRAIAS
jgi:hypothetical protein